MKRWLRKREEDDREEDIHRGFRHIPEIRDCAVAVLIVSPAGIPLIRDSRKEFSFDGRPQIIYWKLPGGKAHIGEDPLDAAVREVQEEVGARLNQSSLRVVSVENKGTHDSIVYVASTQISRFKSTGDEAEEVRIFSPEELRYRNDFFPPHRRAIGLQLFTLCNVPAVIV